MREVGGTANGTVIELRCQPLPRDQTSLRDTSCYCQAWPSDLMADFLRPRVVAAVVGVMDPGRHHRHQTVTVLVSDTTPAIEFPDGDVKVVRRTTAQPVRSSRADSRGSLPQFPRPSVAHHLADLHRTSIGSHDVDGDSGGRVRPRVLTGLAGKTKTEIMRCLKRSIARATFAYSPRSPTAPAPIGPCWDPSK